MSGFPERLEALQPFWGAWYLDFKIGEGNFGQVYRIHRREFGEDYYSALKWIPLPQSQSEVDSFRREGIDDDAISAYYDDYVRVMQSEIKLMNRLRGTSHIVSFEDHAFIRRRDEIGWDILIRMELLTPLPQRIREGMTVGDVVKMGIDLCDALCLCEKNKIVHRDIKPDNIFLNSNGDYKLGDFGVARQLQGEHTNMSQKGTPLYMAPELYFGRQSDAAVDQYSLGLVMHRLLNAQQIPFAPAFDRILTHTEREEAFTLRMQGNAIPPPLQGSAQLKSIVCRACSFQPKKRYASPEALRDALSRTLKDRECAEPLIFGNGPKAGSLRSTLSPARRPKRAAFRRRPVWQYGLAAAGALGLTACLALAGIRLLAKQKAPEAPTDEPSPTPGAQTALLPPSDGEPAAVTALPEVYTPVPEALTPAPEMYTPVP